MSFLGENRNWYSLSAVLLLMYILLRVSLLFPRWQQEYTNATLSWDVYGYYLYLPALLIHNDLGELKFKDDQFQKYLPAGDFHHAYPQQNGRWVMKYPSGMAILYLPFFLIAHLLAGWLGFPADGFSLPYQMSISLGMLLYGFLGLLVLRRLLLRWYSDLVTAFTLAVLVLGSNLLNYLTIDNAMPHGPLFMCHALLLALTVAWHDRPRKLIALAMGLLIGLMTIARPTELLVALIPLLWGVGSKADWQAKIKLLWERRADVVLLAMGLMVVGSLQLFYWKFATGSWVYYSYQDQGFDWLNPHIINGLFSYKKGWFIYSPAMLVVIPGFVFLWRQNKKLFWPLFVFIVLHIYVVFSWSVWWYGGGLGARPMVQVLPELALVIGAFMAAVSRNRALTVAMVIFFLLTVEANLMYTYQAHSPDSGWYSEGPTRAYFWKTFGSPRNDPGERIFLDIGTELRSERGWQSRTLYFNDFESDAQHHVNQEHARDSRFSLLLDPPHPEGPVFSVNPDTLPDPQNGWLRVEADIFYIEPAWDQWTLSQIKVVWKREDGTEYRKNGVRLQWLTEPWQWHQVKFEMPLPYHYQEGDLVTIYPWNNDGPGRVWIDNYRVSYLWPEKN